jgi:hypothetical protein
MAGAIRQRHKHFLLSDGHPVDVLVCQSATTAIAMFVTQPFTDAHRRIGCSTWPQMVSTIPPSTRSAAPVVADESGEAT